MWQTLRDARAVYAQAGAATPFDLWLETRREIERRSLDRGFNRLGASFAASMMERAVMDAVGRDLGLSFDQMVRGNVLGIRLGAVFDEVSFERMISALPAQPLERVALRHTVGLVDAISDADRPADAPDDGLPVTMEEYIKTDRLNWLKIKVSGDRTTDLARLTAMADAIDASERRMRITLDGNEQYRDLGEFAALVDQIRSTPALEDLWRSVIFIEQPLRRDTAMAAPLPADARTAIDRPLLIDEADGWTEAFRDAIDLGWEGVSHKNCKGVYRSLINAGLADARNEALGENRYFLSAEDLTNLAVVPLQADLAVVATLGISHVERNGHHYFRGLDHLPAAEREQALIDHPDLYEHMGGSGALRIESGQLDIASLQVSGLGVRNLPDLDDAIPEDDWRFSMLERRG